MKLFLDCEFNGFQGELVSMGLVDEHDHVFYEVLPCLHPVPWVANHVLPVLNKAAIDRVKFQQELAWYLRQYEEVEVIADWPEDIAHFCNMLITGAGRRMSIPPLSMQLCTDLMPVSELPHNALEDAKGLKYAYLSQFLQGSSTS